MSSKVLYYDVEFKTTLGKDAIKVYGVWSLLEAPETYMTSIAWAVDDAPVQYATLPDGLPEEFVEAFKQADVIVAHNIDCDMAALIEKYGMRFANKFLYCTCAGANALNQPGDLATLCVYLGLGKKLDYDVINQPEIDLGSGVSGEEYNKQDVELLRKVFKYQVRELEQQEFRRINAHVRMNVLGLPIDREMLKQAQVEAKQALDSIKKQFKDEIGLNITQSAKIASMIEELDPSPAIRIKNKKGELKVSLNNKSPVYGLLCEHSNAKIKRIMELLRQYSPTKQVVDKAVSAEHRMSKDSRLRGEYKYSTTVTGRWSSRGVQMQNIKRKSIIKETIKPLDANKSLYVADFASIELRISLCFMGEEQALTRLQNVDNLPKEEADLYFDIAKQVYGAGATWEEHRPKAKQALLAMQYGGGFGAVSKALPGASEEMVMDIIKGVHDYLPKLKVIHNKLWEQLKQAVYATQDGITSRYFGRKGKDIFLLLPTGRKIWYRDVEMSKQEYTDVKTGEKRDVHAVLFGSMVDGKRIHKGNEKKYITFGGTVFNHLCQGFARELMAEAIVALQQNGYQVLGTIHDEVLVEVANGVCQEKLDKIVQGIPCAIPIQLDIESGIVRTWGEFK